MQVFSFDLSSAAPAAVIFDLSFAVPGITFKALAVRVVSATELATILLVGGVDSTNQASYPGVVLYISIPSSATSFAGATVSGSVVLPSGGAGVTALSQTSPLLPGTVLASTDQGVFKCAASSA